MSLAIFFGGTAVLIIVGVATVIHGIRHHYKESEKKKAENQSGLST